MNETENFIDLRQFQLRYRQALIFTLFEGLNGTGRLRFIDEADPKELMHQFIESNLLNTYWKVQNLGNGTWAFEIEKTLS